MVRFVSLCVQCVLTTCFVSYRVMAFTILTSVLALDKVGRPMTYMTPIESTILQRGDTKPVVLRSFQGPTSSGGLLQPFSFQRLSSIFQLACRFQSRSSEALTR